MEHGLEKNLINQHVGLFFLLETGRLCPSVLLNFLLAKLCWTERVPSRDFGPFDPQRGSCIGWKCQLCPRCVCVSWNLCGVPFRVPTKKELMENPCLRGLNVNSPARVANHGCLLDLDSLCAKQHLKHKRHDSQLINTQQRLHRPVGPDQLDFHRPN